MVSTVRVPKPFEPLFEIAEKYVDALFKDFRREPSKGTIHIGTERYVLIRGESLFIALFEQLKSSFGEEQAEEFIYNMARFIGKADSINFAKNRNLTDPNEKLSTGPVHFAYSGWAFVDILPTSAPAPNENYFLHYYHPNTFESEIYQHQKRKSNHPICFFSAGYSAGWCSEAYGLELHAHEIRCTAKGDKNCEFIMAPFNKLAEHSKRLLG